MLVLQYLLTAFFLFCFCDIKSLRGGHLFSRIFLKFDESAYKDDRSEFDAIFNFIIEQKRVAICCDWIYQDALMIYSKVLKLRKNGNLSS